MSHTDPEIHICLWFDDRAGEAAKFYTSLFENSKLGSVIRYTKEGQEFHGKPEGAEMTVAFELENFHLRGLNGGPHFFLNPSISLFVATGEREIEKLWRELGKDGTVLMPLDSYDWGEKYGWLQDRFGLNWQLMLDKENSVKDKICPLMFFAGQSRGRAEEAINYYTSIFKDSDVEGILRYGEEDSLAGQVMHSQFQLLGQTFMAMDGGEEHQFPFSEAISFVVVCDSQEEIDYYWAHLSEEGDEKAQQCGWLKDRFGISWQVVPRVLDRILSSENSTRTASVTRELFKMKKIDLNRIKELYGKVDSKQ